MCYADSLRQQSRWVREALDPATPETQRIELQDIDTDELDAAADEIERLEKERFKFESALMLIGEGYPGAPSLAKAALQKS